MDFNLFALEEDDELLSSICTETTELYEAKLPENYLPLFNCSGVDSSNSQFSNDSFIKNFYVLLETIPEVPSIELTSRKFNRDNLYTGSIQKYILSEVRLNIQILVGILKEPIDWEKDISFFDKRLQLTKFLHLICLEDFDHNWLRFGEKLDELRSFLNSVTIKSNLELTYMNNNLNGNDTETTEYHFFHGALEWKIIDLVILRKQERKSPSLLVDNNPIEDNCSKYVKQLERFFDHLVYLSLLLYEKKNLPELIFSSPFPCTCVKECWLVVQILIEKFQGRGVFWNFFNKSLEKLKTSDSLSKNVESFTLFSVWLIKGVMRLQGYKSDGTFKGTKFSRVEDNYAKLLSTLDMFLNSNPSEEQIRVFLCIMMPIVLEWWMPKVDIPITLWEHFHKKLNGLFFIAGSLPSELAKTSSSGKGYLDKTRNLLTNCNADANKSSFTLFTIILGKTIEFLRTSRQNNHIQKIHGRIFSKFSLSKLLTLNETGIHNLIELFLSLALCDDLTDIGPKLKDKLLSIPLQNIAPNRQIAITKGHVALLILYSEQFLDISDYIKKLLDQISSIKQDVAVSKILLDGLCDIFETTENFDRGEHLLIDTWLPNFLQTCSPGEQERVLKIIFMIIDKIKMRLIITTLEPVNYLQNIIKSLNDYILPYIKQQYSNNFSPWIGKLAANFCILIPFNDSQQFQKLFRYFIDINGSNKQAPIDFILVLLGSEKLNLVPPSVIIQIWLKSLVLLSPNNEEVLKLTKIVIKLEEFCFVCNETELESSNEPLCLFVSAVGKMYDASTDLQRKHLIADKFNVYLQNFEKWLTEKDEKMEGTFRFYSFIAIVIYNCASIVYTKSNITCFFHIAVTRFLLPTTIQMGKAPEGKLAQTMHKVWPVVVQGIGKLNFQTDPYIRKTLTDLTVKWTPHFKISSNSKVVSKPFITCLNGSNDALSLFILDKLTTMFLAMQRRQADPNACLVLKIFQEIVEENAEDDNKMSVLLKASSLTMLEHLMMVDEIVPSRNMLLELFKKIMNTSAFKNSIDIRSIIIEHLKIITVKNLSFFTFFYFELLTNILKIYYPIIEELMDFLQKEINVVETKRGGGEDNRLRSCFQKLKETLVAAKNDKH